METVTTRSGVRGALTSVGGQAAKFAVQFVGLAVLARILAPGDFGLYTMIAAIVGIAGVIGDLGLSLAAIQAPSLSSNEKTQLFWWNAFLATAIGILVFLSAPLVVSVYGQPELADAVHVVSLIFVLNGLTVQFRAEINRELRFSMLATLDILSQVAGVGMAILLALDGWGFWSLAWQGVVAAAAGLVMTLICARWRPSLPRRGVPMRGFLRFGAATTVTQVVNYSSLNLDSVLVGRYLGEYSLGIYSKAFQLFTLPAQQLLAPLTRVAVPILSRVEDPEAFERLMLRIQKGVAYVLVVILATEAALAPEIVSVLLGSRWSAASGVLVLLIPGGIFQALGSSYYWAFLAKARISILMYCELSGRAFMLLLIAFAAPHGVTYVSVAVSTGMFAVWFVTTMYGLPRIGVSRVAMLGESWRPLVGAVVIYGTVSAVRIFGSALFPQQPVVVAVSCVSAGVFALAAWTRWPPVRQDLGVIVRIVRRAGASQASGS